MSQNFDALIVQLVDAGTPDEVVCLVDKRWPFQIGVTGQFLRDLIDGAALPGGLPDEFVSPVALLNGGLAFAFYNASALYQAAGQIEDA
ncbi:MAG: hypothetical protein NUV51_05825, partial [Sulfuricaulis sp.]|nr:hypothetical protein [Sulfuricaulis sp.]